ncbi:MAG: type II toxin-antitoxin system prevent-host-death family antitoxin [Scytonema sp. PMC 1069.18]|nr:type II toxin-antitoxin system prevent-host-death family antitoxin [Scytonema sp. PMC 1069.18]MEC4883240.1 type II toxin-antitoxin system prevent-host-death family antitoxin [Scytonema sp. PMC 1070.18]
MEYLSSKEAQNNFSELLDKAQKAPVTIRRYGRDSVVVISVNEFNEYKQWRAQRLKTLVKDINLKARENGLTDEILEQILAEDDEPTDEESEVESRL